MFVSLWHNREFFRVFNGYGEVQDMVFVVGGLVIIFLPWMHYLLSVVILAKTNCPSIYANHKAAGSSGQKWGGRIVTFAVVGTGSLQHVRVPNVVVQDMKVYIVLKYFFNVLS